MSDYRICFNGSVFKYKCVLVIHSFKTKGEFDKNILLVCAAGMSTSLLVTKMQQAAKEKGLRQKFRKFPLTKRERILMKADVVLLGPQIRYKLPELKKEGKERGIPVEVISPVDYGTVNGKKVLELL